MDDFAAPPQGKRAWHSFALSSEQFVWLVSHLCKLNGVDIDDSRLLKDFRPPHTRDQLINAMRAHGLRAEPTTIKGEQLENALLPLVAFPREVLGSEETPDYLGAGLIIGLIGERFLYVEADSEEPRLRLKRHFREFFEPIVILGSRIEAREPEPVAYSASSELPR